ncbi:MAG: LysR family transcriptional regulator [Vibrio toranzoniae]|jgi:DNA-binding transcriptional LysR family regulator|uniref:LysR family transcriptional regulator n=1 Tax=Vibrio toranzoniae TaxID=1194427 RepID=A0A120DGN0_9VIBR|nr:MULTISPECIES: LysR family transcriptional regulator [Vibrio]KWU01145.1 LysR family transcriptional regulator [Vibrio toranzoniae]MDA0145021.1 LysR family transcriptional regulator [Vibrio sp. RW]NAZ53335.1 LysR family transcriptional regulator [Vibrio toranzoniae]NAZ68812.1 LysR family transcriptional regulator [Vibrio toranzoniae]NAZ97160.1 LysR family transcriptional regulator [Vibrio toranzoniae]
MRLKTTLDQWQTLYEIDRAGSIQAAALQLNKSHTTLIYALRKLEDQLGMTLVQVEGRRAVLSEDGKSLLRRASSMLEQARELELISEQLAKGVESEIVVAVDHLCCLERLYQPMATFLAENNTTSIQVIETSLSKTTEMVTQELADVAIINLPITNYSAEAFGFTMMEPVVACSNPLVKASSVSLNQLSSLPQIVVRDLGSVGKLAEKKDVGWLKSSQRITVDNFDHAFGAVEQGVGYCRLPKHIVESRVSDKLTVLNVENGSGYHVPLHLTLPKGAKTGPAAKRFYELLLESAPPAN